MANFKTNVLLKSILGKDLINNDNIAVLELVKNSYDAGSSRVNVVFKNIKDNDDLKIKTPSQKTSKVIIQDFGSGMDLDDLENKWLNIAYSEKKSKEKEHKRILAGAKGVGRFSCDRLGEFLNIYTKKSGKPIYHLSINWNDFEVEGKRDLAIQQIPVTIVEISPAEYKKRTGEKPPSHGTYLEISKLRSAWSHKEKDTWSTTALIGLRSYLAKLTNPNQAFAEDMFEIYLSAEEFKNQDKNSDINSQINGKIKNLIFKNLDFKTTSIESGISKDGKEIETVLKDKGRTIFRLVEKNTQYDLLKDLKIVVYYLNPYAKAFFKKQTGVRSGDFGSMFLFIRGFRVNPLGDAGNDWLSMDLRKGQGYARFLGTRETVGRIEINNPGESFKVISSREGVVQDATYRQLVDRQPSSFRGFFYETLRRLEKYVIEGLDWDTVSQSASKLKDEELLQHLQKAGEETFQESQKTKDLRSIKLIYSVLAVKPENVLSLYINEKLLQALAEESEVKAEEYINKLLSEHSRYASSVVEKGTVLAFKNLKNALTKTERKLIETKEEVQNLQEENVQRKAQVRFLQSAQSLELENVVSLHHHIGINADTIQNQILRLKQISDTRIPSKEEILGFIDDISFATRKILAITRFATKANFVLDAQEIKGDLMAFIKQYIEDVTRVYNSSPTVAFQDKSNISYQTSFKPIEWSIIVDNLVSNSRKAHAKHVNISAKKLSNGLEIVFTDNGNGLDKTIKDTDSIFEKGFSTTNGSGLGLYHVKQILDEMGGKIETFKQKGDLGFKITLKK